MMKFHFKLVVGVALLCGAGLFLSATYWTRCELPTPPPNDLYSGSPGAVSEPEIDPPQEEQQESPSDVLDDTPYEPISCVVNDEMKVPCRREENQVFVPFSFIKRYFEIYGGLEVQDGKEVLNWQHSYSNVYAPRGRYSPRGVFMSFEHYNVEIRDRVKCISGIEGVPLSTQWGPQGYFYPIQIAQYGLSHYSKYLVDPPRTQTVIEDGEDETTERWAVVGSRARVNNVYDGEARSHVIQFQTSESWKDPGAKLPAQSNSEFHLSMDFKFAPGVNSSISVNVQPKGKRPDTYCIRYVISQTLISRGEEGDNTIIIGIGDRTRWSHISRDLAVDFMKGVNLLFGGDKEKTKRLMLHKVLSVVLRGQGLVDNVTLASNAHLAQFYYAANWLVLHQDERGGWPIMVTRKVTQGIPELAPGWYSAMAQGQAMSLLVRAYIRTQNQKYLDSALKATALYSIPSSEGGVMAKFMGKHVWYEEYPTTPSTFVLNGFIYSLIGLYDLQTIAPRSSNTQAAQLYRDGMESLHMLLPLYDTGSGSVYDLRHVALGTAPNLARWDYHATHINQLLLLATVQDTSEDRLFYESTAQRWMSYMKGKRARHN